MRTWFELQLITYPHSVDIIQSINQSIKDTSLLFILFCHCPDNQSPIPRDLHSHFFH